MFRSIYIWVWIFNIRYRIRIWILKLYIYDVNIQSYPIWHGWHYLYSNPNPDINMNPNTTVRLHASPHCALAPHRHLAPAPHAAQLARLRRLQDRHLQLRSSLRCLARLAATYLPSCAWFFFNARWIRTGRERKWERDGCVLLKF
jgi:hypothetical protein